jgi:hypothetical protein
MAQRGKVYSSRHIRVRQPVVHQRDEGNQEEEQVLTSRKGFMRAL